MPSPRAIRMKRIALGCNVGVLIGVAALLASVFVMHEPRPLLMLALPLSWLAMAVQLAAFKAENAERHCPRCASQMDVVTRRATGERRQGTSYSCPSCGARFRTDHGDLVADHL